MLEPHTIAELRSELYRFLAIQRIRYELYRARENKVYWLVSVLRFELNFLLTLDKLYAKK